MTTPVTTDPRTRASVAVRLVQTRFLRHARSNSSAVVCLFFLSTFVQAQSAHFSGAVRTVGVGFNSPAGVAVDGTGDIFVADYNNNVVKEIVAVNGVVSSSSAVNTVGSGFSHPQGVAVDAAGDVFVADQGNNAVKEIVAVGGVVSSISTVNTVGGGFAGPSAVALDAAGDVFVADQGHSAVKEIVAVGGLVSSSSTVNTVGGGFDNASAVAVDNAGDVFVADASHNAVKEIVAVSGAVSSNSTVNIVGSGFSNPYGVAVDSAGDVFVGDYGNNAVKEIVAVGGLVSSSSTVIAVGGGFNGPRGVAVDGSGNVFVPDISSNSVKEIELVRGVSFGSLAVATSTPTTLSLTFTFDTGGTIDAPAVLTQGSAGLDFTDAGTGTCTTNGTSHSYNAGDTCAVDGTFIPTQMGARYGAVVLYKNSGTAIATAYLSGTGNGPLVNFTPYARTTLPGTFSAPEGISGLGDGSLIIADSGNVYKETYSAGSYTKSALVASTDTILGQHLNSTQWVATDGGGNLFLADGGNGRVIKIPRSLSGGYDESAASYVCSSSCGGNEIAVDAIGDVYTLSGATEEVQKFTLRTDGSYVGSAAYSGGLNNPWGIAIDPSGNVFFVDAGTNKLYKLTYSGGAYAGSLITLDSSLDSPVGLSLDNQGNVYVAENSSTHDIVKETFVSGTTYAKSIVSSSFNSPVGVFVDNANNLYIGDTGGGAVIKLDTSDPPSLSFASTAAGSTSSDSPETITITNNGDGPLTFEVPGAGLNPSISAGFAFGGGSTCPQLSTGSSVATLASGASCTELVSFTPTAAGSPVIGSLATTDNNLNAAGPAYTTQEIALSGTATASPITASTTVASTSFTQGHEGAAVTPVSAAGGTTPLTYSVTPTLPAGLSFSSSTGAIGGIPTVTSASTTYTVTVTDANGATATATFSLTMNPAVTATAAVPATNLTQNHTAAAFTPVTGSGGAGTLTYSVSPTLPAGLSLSSSTGAIGGIPTVTSASTTYTVTVTDANGATAAATFSLTVNPAVTATAAVPSTTMDQNHAATPFVPVTGSGGTGALTYRVSPTLPAGLSFSASTGAVAGTPTVTGAATTCTVSVTDINGATAMATFSLTVNPAVTATVTVPSTTLDQSHAAAFTPVTGSGGTGPLIYSVSPALPAGLSFFFAAGTIIGTPTVTCAAIDYTVTVTDATGATATATFSLTVNPAVAATAALPSTTLDQNHAATPFIPVTGSGGTGILRYSVSPALPAGLSLFSSTGAVTGTPTVTSAARSYTVTATDANGATATATFSLTVNATVTATSAVPSTTLTQNHAATPFIPVTGSGGTGTLSYSVSPALPAGLSFSASPTGTISGTPTANGAVTGTPTVVSAATTHSVTVTDANGATATATFSLTVNPAVTATAAIPLTTLDQNHAVAPFIPVTGSGGTGTLTYSVSPALPAGLNFSSSTATISGTPTTTSAATTYTVTVTDANSASVAAAFSLAVNTAVTATTAVPSTTLTQNHAVAPFIPVTGSGGTGTLTYSVSPALPAGLNFSSSTGTISGTPTTTSAATTYTVTAADANGATATAAFSLTVNSAVTATTTSLSASPTTQLSNNPVALAAQVTSATAGILTGTVSFLDGTSVIATVPIGANGLTTYSDSSLAAGSHTLMAAYSGDANFLPSSSAAIPLAITISDLNLNLGSSQNETAVPGAAVSYTLSLSPLGTPTFLYDVRLTATGLPAGATYTFLPALISAGSASTPVTLTVQTAKGVAISRVPKAPGQQDSSRGLTALAFGLMVPLLGARRVRRQWKVLPKPLTMIMFPILSIGAMAALNGCGSGGFFGPTATSGRYTITVTATSANLVRTSTVELTIQ